MLELLAGPISERFRSVQFQRLPRNLSLWILLSCYDEPLVGFWQSGVDNTVCGLLLRLCLFHLMRREIEFHSVLENRIPRQVFANGFIELWQASFISSQKYQRIAIQTRGAAARLKD